MQLRTSLATLLVVALSLAHTASAAPRDDAAHKFTKREPGTHVHHHYGGSSGGGGGMMGSSGGSMARNVVGGTLLAGGAGFAATAGSIGAHNMFHHNDDDGERKGGEGEGGRGAESAQQVVSQQPVYAQPPPQPRAQGGVRPVGIMMSDGSVLPVAGQAQAARDPVDGVFVFPHTK
ncbi:conserved hypothetical protein [Sporisorium reilianum SRZ2]|uniref:Uncharacterized protein n=1 Tax=Sporisorium reilianum (strain SRZ2) TaxID=999809 RepID=E6ZZ43_SPORE|nr:conserved hypothetical protein [Sporisorium reilianum SRZ2]